MVSEIETTFLHLFTSSQLFIIKESCIFEDRCTVETSNQILLKTQNSESNELQTVYFLYHSFNGICFRTFLAAWNETLPEGHLVFPKGFAENLSFPCGNSVRLVRVFILLNL